MKLTVMLRKLKMLISHCLSAIVLRSYGNINKTMRWQVQKRQKKAPFNVLGIVVLWNLLFEDAVNANISDYCKSRKSHGKMQKELLSTSGLGRSTSGKDC